MHCHFLIPGLLWPPESLRDATRDLPLPALEMLLGRGRREWRPAVGAERWLAERFGLSGDELPYGALRLAGETTAPGGVTPTDAGGATWICADPVSLHFAREFLILGDTSDLTITDDEAAQLVALLNEHCGDLGRFHAAGAERWYLRLREAPTLRTHPPAEAVGRRINNFMPGGGDAARWHHHLNEAQVLLHTHPVNRARENDGRPPINSVWFWGAGVAPRSLSAPCAVLLGAQPLTRGLAALAGIEHHPPSESFDVSALAAGNGGTLVVLDPLAIPARHLDRDAWREALARLEVRWLAPALAALRRGQLARLDLTALGDTARINVTVERTGLWQLWRRPLPLADLTPNAATP
jgi:hypothetical protein